MFANKQGFERITGDEATGAVTGMTLSFIGGVVYLGAEEGNPFAHNSGAQELQPDNTAHHKPSQTTAIDVLSATALAGAVLGAVITQGARRIAHRHGLNPHESRSPQQSRSL